MSDYNFIKVLTRSNTSTGSNFSLKQHFKSLGALCHNMWLLTVLKLHHSQSMKALIGMRAAAPHHNHTSKGFPLCQQVFLTRELNHYGLNTSWRTLLCECHVASCHCYSWCRVLQNIMDKCFVSDMFKHTHLLPVYRQLLHSFQF